MVVVLAVCTGIYLSRKPWQEYREQKAVTRGADLDMKKAENDRAELVGQGARLENPAGRERTARLRGYRKANETPLEDLK